MNKALLYIAMLLTVLLFSNCKKDDEIIKSPDDPGTDVPSDGEGIEIEAEKKVEVFDKVNVFLNDLSWTDRTTAHQSIVAFLEAMPEIKKASYSEESDNVWAEFTDGTIYLVLNNRPNENNVPDPDYSNLRTDLSNQRTQEMVWPVIPSSKKVYIFSGVGNYFKSSRTGNDFLKYLFQQDEEKTGYEPQIVDASIKNLKEIQDAGVFYFSSHGGYIRLNERDSIYGAYTSDNVDAATEKAYKADVKKRDLVYITAYNKIENGKKIAETHWGITSNFVKKHMKFPKHGIIYLDICQSFVVKDFWWSFHSKSDATGTVLGWTDKVDDGDAYSTAAYFFDRMIAANTKYPVTKPEDPKQRTFNLPAIFNDMIKKDLGKSIPYRENPGRVAYLTYHAAPNMGVILRPSISYMMVHEFMDWLIIWGEFGEDPGEGNREVTVNNVPVESIDEWDPAMLKCKIKSSGTGSAGDVIVKARGIESHPRTLTEWRGTIKYTRPSSGTVSEEATMNIHIRRDIGLYRKAPGESPVKVPLSVFNHLAKDSKGSYKMGGSVKYVSQSSTCVYTGYANWTAKSRELPLFDPLKGETESFIMQIKELENGFQGNTLSLVGLQTSPNTRRTDWACPGDSGTGENETSDWEMQDIPETLKTFNMIFDEGFVIKKGKLTDKLDDNSGVSFGGDDFPQFEATLEWGPISPNFLPKDNAAL